MRENLVQQRAFQFALDVIALYCKLRDEREYVLSRQLLRSGTSIGANIEEALAGQSRNDFIAKMAIASKEAREANYWLRLLQASELTQLDISKELKESQEIIRLLTSILKTAVANKSN
ncbi:MAG TPA: four helix bundle protein [Chloroflexia bacterium]